MESLALFETFLPDPGSRPYTEMAQQWRYFLLNSCVTVMLPISLGGCDEIDYL